MELRIYSALNDAELRGLSPPASSLLLFDICSFVGGLSFRHNKTNKQQQSRPNIVALGPSLYFLFFPATFKLVSAACYSTDQPPNLLTAPACTLHGLKAVRDAASIELSAYISVNFRRSRVSKKGILPVAQYLKEIIPKMRRAASPPRVGLTIQQLVLIINSTYKCTK